MSKGKRQRTTKGTPMYSYGVVAFFPEAIAHRADQACTVDAPSIEDAARAGLLKLRERDGIKGKHFKTLRITVSYICPAADKRGQIALETEGS